jgi:hypothetical protein
MWWHYTAVLYRTVKTYVYMYLYTVKCMQVQAPQIGPFENTIYQTHLEWCD